MDGKRKKPETSKLREGNSETGLLPSQKLERSVRAKTSKDNNTTKTRELGETAKRRYPEGSKKSILRKKLKRRT